MKRLISIFTSLVVWIALGGSAVAAINQVPDYANGAENSTCTIYLTALTVALGLGFIALYTFIFRNERNENFSRNFIILTVVFSALFLIVAGYSEQQTAPVFGLLGTIIGYLFGVTTKPKLDDDQNDSRDGKRLPKGGGP